MFRFQGLGFRVPGLGVRVSRARLRARLSKAQTDDASIARRKQMLSKALSKAQTDA